MADKKTSDGAPPQAGKRWLKMAGMTTSIAARYAGHQIKKPFLDDEARRASQKKLNAKNGETIAETLGELKGAVMKMGQLASQVADLLPAEFAENLKVLQREAPPMAYSVIAAQIEAELGDTPQNIFSRFDEEPFAAASIGQVHRACTQAGDEVIVKVQYPGVAESVRADMRQLKRAMRMGRIVKVSKKTLDALFEEIQARILEELDYEREAAMLLRFSSHFSDTPKLVIPTPHDALSTARVLTLSYEPGDHIDSVPGNYEQATINDIAETLFRCFFGQLFELNSIHADPHAGNFAFRSDGTVVLYDFGCVKELSKKSVMTYGKLVQAALDGDYDAIEAGLLDLGARVPGGERPTDEFYASWRDVLLKPFLTDDPFDFGQSNMHKKVAARTSEVMKLGEQLQPAVETTFVDRMVGGHYWTMVNLGAKNAFGPLLRELLADAKI